MKPNIIFLMTDQQRWDCIGRYNRHILTPNIDRLADEGILYNQAVCQAPMCVPSRYSMMYGLYPSQLGVRTNYGGITKEELLPSAPLPELMRRAGYQTAGFGKTHWNHNAQGKAEPSARGFEHRAVGLARESGHYEQGAVMMGDIHPERLQAYMDETKDYGAGEENASGYIGRTSGIPMNHHRDGWVAEQCLHFIEEGGIDSTRPLFLYLSFLKPHAGFNVPKEFEDLYRLEDIPELPQPPWETEVETHLAATDMINQGSRKAYLDKRAVWESMTALERRRTTLRYWANCTWLDHYFGQVLDRLRIRGVLDNAMIVFVSDHGEMLGERRFRFSKYCLYDSSVRVPLILSGSFIAPEKRGTVDDRPAELVDLVPTLSKVACLPRNPMLPGLDLLGDAVRRGSFCEFHGKGAPVHSAPAYMWRTKEWKLILYLEGAAGNEAPGSQETRGELYHLQSDPHEWTNLYGDEAHAKVRERLKTELLMQLAVAWAKAPVFYDKRGLAGLEAYYDQA
ncbi:sulfatase-like hydrolase/transferase [Paenibacillus filicis]|uniref:Sulfatase-like hydrolase/transferase n=1 Tax=Paenibacillus gyeongsangnamensis TaxID=3388067 RepID=A0ABT4QFY7_9BACL|nr:sulfatase-like hydrolase/transferase [Paenibacillus filicis]MCZ8515793.1 sulfatase-like hydrolase/transferase [Paenibacillus filicis]